MIITKQELEDIVRQNFPNITKEQLQKLKLKDIKINLEIKGAKL